jgi:hypothetical protein
MKHKEYNVNKKKSMYLIVVIALSIVSCNPVIVKRPYTLNAAYAEVNFANRKILVVMPDDAHILIANPKDVINDYGGLNVKPESRVRKFYFPLFYESFASLVSGDSIALWETNRPNFPWNSLVKRQLMLPTGTDSVQMGYSVPEKAAIDSAGLDSAVLVIIERIEFKRNNFYMEYFWDEKTKRQANLEATVLVLVWDCGTDAPVFLGPLSQKIEFQFGMQRKHWDESARLLAKKIVMTAKCL